MIDLLRKRRLRKRIKEYLHAARHARHMREDIAEPKDLAALRAAEAAVREIGKTGRGDVEKALGTLAAAADRVYPAHYRTGVRENVEVVIVALGAAMAIRAFFFQPFKIPTGSMQPTLNGITTEAQAGPGLVDRQPLKFAKWLLTGESYKEFRAKAAGEVDRNARFDRDDIVIEIGGVPHRIPVYLRDELRLKPRYDRGDVIVGAKVIAGDHILVNKMKYNFTRPKRGDIAVFDTKNIAHLQVCKDTFYIKRMVGLPGERIQIRGRRIVADGRVVEQPPVFGRIATDPAYDGGHRNDGELGDESAFIQLAADEYLMCGDNTRPNMSLDGRFFGGVPREDFQGPAFFVYWPFREHWGRVR